MVVERKILEFCRHYEKVTGINCKTIKLDNQYNVGNMTCDLCKRLQSLNIIKEKCEDVFKYSYYQAERFGGKYIFFCSTGLAYFCSKISNKRDINGIVIAGPVNVIDKREYIEDEIFSKVKNLEANIVLELYDLVNGLPSVKPDEITSLSEILHNSIQGITNITDDDCNMNKDFVENIKSIKIDTREIKSYSIVKEKELLLAIKQSNEKKSKEILNEILASLFVSKGMNIKILRNRVYELTILLSRAVMEVGVECEEVFGINCYLLDDINNINDLDELLIWSNKILNKFMDLVFNLKHIKNKDIIFKSIRYINENYMMHITLEEVANHVALSPAYFSTLFKRDMKINFSDYLNKIRIENSKKLLMDNNIKLIEIAYLVGFESQSYYTKVFKKSENITPKQFRQANIGG